MSISHMSHHLIFNSVHIKVLARGDEVTVTLKKVYLAPRLAKNIVSYEKVKI